MTMYSAVSTFTLKPGSSEAVERVLTQQAALIKSQPGCQSIAFVKISEDKIVLMQTWDTERHLEDARTATMGSSVARQIGDAVLSRESVQGEVIAS
jgi:quinol monooxygenase YgiN